MAIYTTVDGRRIKSTTNPDGTKTKTVLYDPNASKTVTQNNSAPSNIDNSSQVTDAVTAPIKSPIQATAHLQSTTTTLPEPTAGQVQETYMNSIAGDVQRARDVVNTTLTTDKTRVDSEIAALEKEQDSILKKGESLTQPFREKLENKERERLYINQNFEANQKLINELDSLLTEGNELIKISKGRAVANTVLNKSVNKTIADVQARAGVIQAVMSARSGQIAEAQRLIDRSVNAITADRNDQINYYNTLLSLNNNKLIKLDAESEAIAVEQRNLAYRDLQQAEETANYVKSLMINPESAQFMADAGVTLQDSVDDVKVKLAKQTKREEVKTVTNNLVQEGYEVSSTPKAGAFEIDAGGEKLYATVRPGSPLALKIKAQELAIEGQRQSISASRTAQLLSLAKAGDAKSIKALGFDPREIPAGGEKLDATTKRQVSDALNAGEGLLAMATKYKNLVDTRGYTNSVFGDREVIGEIKSLRAQMTAKYKDYATLGTLDAGVINLMDSILGEEPISTFNPFTNITGRKSDRLSSQLGSFIDEIQSDNAKNMARLGLDTSVDFSLVPDEDIYLINKEFGVTSSTTSSTVSSYFE